MIGFAVRLTLRGGREALIRTIVIATAVALGVGLLLTTLAGITAVNRQNDRYAWLETGAGAHPPADPGTSPTWWRLSADEFHGNVIGRVEVAPTGPHPPVPPGIPALPGPGEFYASPALSKLLRQSGPASLRARTPGRQIGEIGPAGLPAPTSLVLVIGDRVDQLSHDRQADLVDAISTSSPSNCTGPCFAIGIDANGISLVLWVVAVALLFPLLIFLGVASRLSAAQREMRFAAMRLVGATPRQVTLISTVESTLAAVTGMALGFGLFFAFRPVLAPIPFTGDPFFTSDLALSPLQIVLVALGVPLGAAIASRLALRRVTISPLGVTRRVTPGPPSPYRLLLLIAGLAELSYFAAIGRPLSTNGQILAFVPGILVTMAGLILAGPWLTMCGSRLVARRTNSPSGLVAARRLADDPKAGFRAISGLVLGLFVASVAVAVMTTINAYDGRQATTATARATVVDDFRSFVDRGYTTQVQSIPPSVLSSLQAIPGVQAYAIVRHLPLQPPDPDGVVNCADLTANPGLGVCAPGARTGQIEVGLLGSKFVPHGGWLPSTYSPSQLAALPVGALAVTTDGSYTAIELVRTLLERALPYPSAERYPPLTIAENQALGNDAKRNAAYQRLADVVILATLPIAGCTLAVGIIAGLNDRRRPFGLLRLTGAPVGLLRRVILLESAVPLLAGAVAALGVGFLTSYLFLRAQLSETLHSPGPGFYAVVLAGVVASLAVVASTFPVLRRLTGPEAVRND
jgi:hypothetical protein